MKIIWREFWIFLVVLTAAAIGISFIHLPWWGSLLVGAAIGGLWPRKIVKDKSC